MSHLSSEESFSRRRFFYAFGGASSLLLFPHCKTVAVETPASLSVRSPKLPWSTVFKGEQKFNLLCERASKENWSAQPIGQRTTTVGRALCGTPYGNYTLEIDDKIESPSVNFNMLDCWTFYEASLAFSRMIKNPSSHWNRETYLRYIELERYRNGVCDGTYLSRMHHLEEVFANNQSRGLGLNPTSGLGGASIHRNVREMQSAWKSYRYLRNDPSLVPEMAKIERRVSDLPVTYIPKSKVAGIESKLQDGDVLAVASSDPGGYTSHVGLAVRDGSTCRFMHATSSNSKGRCCIVDSRISSYLLDKRSSIGLIVFRPAEAPVLA